MTTNTNAWPPAWLPPTDFTSTGAHSLLIQQRAAAAQQLIQQALPTAQQEQWRYTSLRALLAAGLVHSAHNNAAMTDALPDAAAITMALQPAYTPHRVVFINGQYAPQWSTCDQLPAGVEITSRHALFKQNNPLLPAGVMTPDAAAQPFTLLNTAGSDDGLVLRVHERVKIAPPIELLHIASAHPDAAPIMTHPRHTIQLDAAAEVYLIERFISLTPTACYCTNAVIEIDLAPGAVLRHERLQLESPQAFHLTGLYLRQSAASQYYGLNVGLGGRWSRTNLMSYFTGSQAHCEQRGLYVIGQQQFMDYHLDIAHQVPQCTSREQFKGILYGRGRGVFDGRIFVAPNAQQSDAAMTNNNLLLSRDAEIDTKPQLEIYADDVKCSHGTTIGQLEPDMLFYLQSRGLDATQARQLLGVGFAADVLQTLQLPALHEQITAQVEQCLAHAAIN